MLENHPNIKYGKAGVLLVNSAHQTQLVGLISENI